MKKIIEFKNVSKIYGEDENKTYALRNANLTVNKGEFVVILGPSGAGKSTLLNLLGGMDSASGGEIIVDNKNIVGYSDNELSDYRAVNVGFVFQFYNLIPTLTAYENVALTDSIVKEHLNAKDTLNMVGLKEHLNKFPSQLSGGEQQRVSIARALSKNPKMLLCDEPTGALDIETGIIILSLLKKMSREHDKSVIIVTHNSALVKAADKVIHIRNGEVTDIKINKSPIPVKEVNY